MDKVNSVGPDIDGIRRVLKITNELYSEYEDSSSNNKSIERNCSNFLVVSKLDPTVKEFCPGQFNTRKIEGFPSVNVSVSNKIDISNSRDDSSKNLKPLPKASDQRDVSVKTPSNKVIDHHININDVGIDNEQNSIKQRTAPKSIDELQEIIIKTSKSDNPVHKLQRNVAIANVMKLYVEEATPENFQPKLLSPDYFMASKNWNLDLEAEKASKENPEQWNCEDVLVETEVEEEEADRIRDSIAKVTEWLDMPKDRVDRSEISTETEKAKSRLEPVLGPITFRKKITSSSKSPSLPVSNAPESPHKIKKYVPSKLADDLLRKYKENQKKVIVSDIWTKLEMELIERDKQIRKTQYPQ